MKKTNDRYVPESKKVTCFASPMPCLLYPKKVWSEKEDLAMTEGMLPDGIPFAAELCCPEPQDATELDFVLPVAAFPELLDWNVFREVVNPEKSDSPSTNNTWPALIFYGIQGRWDVTDFDFQEHVYTSLQERGLFRVKERDDDILPDYRISLGLDPKGMAVLLFAITQMDGVAKDWETTMVDTDLTFTAFRDLFCVDK